MRLYDEIFKNAEGAATARCIIVPRGGGYFQGVKSVGDFSPERVVLYFPKEGVEVTGDDLTVKKYCDGDLHLAGKIRSVVLLQEKED